MEATTHHLEDKAEKLKTMDEELEEEIEKLKMECRKRILKEQYKNDYKKVKQELRYIIPSMSPNLIPIESKCNKRKMKNKK